MEPVTNSSTDTYEAIEVTIRLKPPTVEEGEPGQPTCVTVSPTESNTVIVETPNKKQYFSFDHVAGEDCRQHEVYESIGRPVLEESLKGYNCCIFAYGQTGAGKTYSILGDAQELGDNSVAQSRGVLPRLLEELFVRLLLAKCRYEVKCTYLQIYNEQIIDLLNKEIKAYPIREDYKRGVYVEGISEQTLHNYEESLQYISKGLKNRKVASTSMNSQSSRSHTIFTINMKLTTQEGEGASAAQVQRYSKIHIVDLAGSERQHQVNLSGERFKEGCNINRSLHCLGNVINSLVESIKKKKYIPFRDSKLTFFLKDSLGGNSKTKLLANINPKQKYLSDTISTLMFAKRAKIIKVRVEPNENKADENLDSLRNEIKKLREELAQARFIKTVGKEPEKEEKERPQKTDKTEKMSKSNSQKSLIPRDKAIDWDFSSQQQRLLDSFAENQNNYRMVIQVYEQRVQQLQSSKGASKGDSNFKQLFNQKRMLQKQNNHYHLLLVNFPSFTRLFKDNLQLRKKVKQLEAEVQKGNKLREDMALELEHMRNNVTVLKEQRDDIQSQMLNYKCEVDSVLASGIKQKSIVNEKVQYPQVLPLLELSRIQDQATLNMTRRQDVRDLMARQNGMLEEYEKVIEELKAKFITCLGQLQESYDELNLLYEHEKSEKNTLKKMKRPEQSPQVEALENENQYLKLNVMELEDEIAQYQKQSFKSAIEIRTLEQSNQKLTKQIDDLRERGLQEAQLVDIVNKLKDIKLLAEKEHSEVEKELSRDEVEFTHLKEKVLKLSHENSALLAKIEAIRIKYKELKKRFGQPSSKSLDEDDEEESGILNTKFGELAKQVSILTAKKVELQKQLEQQSVKNNCDRSKLERTSIKILSISKELAFLKQSNEHEVEELRRMQIRLEESEKEQMTLKERNKILEVEHNRIMKQLDKRQQLSNKIKAEFGKNDIELYEHYKTMEAKIASSKNQHQKSRGDRYRQGTFSSSSRSLKSLNQKQALLQTSTQPFNLSKQRPSIEKDKKQRPQTSAERRKAYDSRKETPPAHAKTLRTDSSGEFTENLSNIPSLIAVSSPQNAASTKAGGLFSKNKKTIEKALSPTIPIPRKK